MRSRQSIVKMPANGNLLREYCKSIGKSDHRAVSIRGVFMRYKFPITLRLAANNVRPCSLLMRKVTEKLLLPCASSCLVKIAGVARVAGKIMA